jgi:hypothetical protein
LKECEGENSELEVRLTIAKLVVKQKRGGNEQPILEHRCQPCCPHRLPELSARVKNSYEGLWLKSRHSFELACNLLRKTNEAEKCEGKRELNFLLKFTKHLHFDQEFRNLPGNAARACVNAPNNLGFANRLVGLQIDHFRLGA